MAFFTLEDLTGRVEVVCLPNIFAEVRALLESEEPLLVTGLVNHNDTGVSLKATEIIPLSQGAEKFSSEIRLKVRLGAGASDKLAGLKEILAEYPGRTPLFVHLVSPGRFETVIEADPRFGLGPCQELFDRVRDLLGPDCLL
ncbi:MAG: hypothetical protein JRJ59_13425 [Deltaproteobacteria bacterium]|nr:hypothetical protein [Deltaproteobacteria bacterium]